MPNINKYEARMLSTNCDSTNVHQCFAASMGRHGKNILRNGNLQIPSLPGITAHSALSVLEFVDRN